jgi:nucleoside-diphosphate-sugar epimerase
VKTLLTGATGFIGTHLIKNLAERGRDIRCLIRKTSDTKHLKQLGVELFVGDLTSRDSLKGAAKDVNIIFHLAGEVYSSKCRDYYKINVDGTKNLVEECLSENIERFVYLSSIAAVGPMRDILLNEQSICRPVNPYGRSKFETERILIKSFDRYGFPITILRAPIVYGPSRRHNIITKILQMIYKGRFLIVGDGKKLRSLCYIDNLCQGLMIVEEFPNSIGEIYFVSDERPYTFNEIFQTIALEMGHVPNEIHLPGWIGEVCGLASRSLSAMGFYSLSLYTIWNMVLDMACDINKAKKQLNYKPKIDTKEGIQRTIRYYQMKLR